MRSPPGALLLRSHRAALAHALSTASSTGCDQPLSRAAPSPLHRREVTVPSLADVCKTDVEFFRRPFTTTIHADTRADAPAELLAQLDALGLQRCGAEPLGFWHQVPDHLDEPAARRLASDAAAALTTAGWSVNIDPGALPAETGDHAAILSSVSDNRTRTDSPAASPAAGTTPRIRGIATPSTDRYPALLALDTAHLLDRVTESLVRADANRGGFIVATTVVPEISPLAALGRLLGAASTHLHKVGVPEMAYVFSSAASIVDDLIEDLNNPAGAEPDANSRVQSAPPSLVPPPADVLRKGR